MCGKSIVMLLMVCAGGLSVWGQKAAPASPPALRGAPDMVDPPPVCAAPLYLWFPEELRFGCLLEGLPAFLDLRHGGIATRKGDYWVTRDGGATWSQTGVVSQRGQATTLAAGQGASPPASQELWLPYESSMVLISYAVTASSEDSSQGATKPRQTLGVMNGTGFLLFGEVGFSKAKVYLVTNRHLLPPEGQPKDIQLRLVVREKDGAAKIEEISVPIVGSNGKYLPSVRLHPDTDVAAVNIARAAFESKFESLIEAIKSGKYVNSSMLLATQRMSAEGVGKGSQVYILGYPAAIFDPRNVSPVLRVGWISTDPQEGFNFSPELRRTMNFPEHINGFLLDANIYPGSAGSLVVLATGQRPYILGIVSGSIPIFDASLPGGGGYSRIGLGMVYSADTIREVLDSFSR
jgi:hypothetical protein